MSAVDASGRIENCFQSSLVGGRKALIPFITAGDPDPAWTVKIMHALVEGGADLLELGVPFSDPTADGPVIRAAGERAIEKGTRLETVLHMVRRFRESNDRTPVVLMGYMNPVLRFGTGAMAQAATKAGVDGLLLVDCPWEEMGDFQNQLVEAGVHTIRLVTPTTTRKCLEKITRAAGGFIYYVTFKGVTGAGLLDAASLSEPINAIRALSDLPIAAGFGIHDADSAVAAARHADAVVIGSALVRRLADQQDEGAACARARRFVASVRESLDNSFP